MIIRIVKLTFEPSKIDSFIAVFDESKEQIRNFPGVHYLRLMQDKNNSNVFFTYSKWDSEDDLEKYRHSKLFISTWAKTKVLFSDKPEAWSLETLRELE